MKLRQLGSQYVQMGLLAGAGAGFVRLYTLAEQAARAAQPDLTQVTAILGASLACLSLYGASLAQGLKRTLPGRTGEKREPIIGQPRFGPSPLQLGIEPPREYLGLTVPAAQFWLNVENGSVRPEQLQPLRDLLDLVRKKAVAGPVLRIAVLERLAAELRQPLDLATALLITVRAGLACEVAPVVEEINALGTQISAFVVVLNALPSLVEFPPGDIRFAFDLAGRGFSRISQEMLDAERASRKGIDIELPAHELLGFDPRTPPTERTTQAALTILRTMLRHCAAYSEADLGVGGTLHVAVHARLKRPE